MAFVPVPNTVMVEVIYEWGGQTCENTLYYTSTTGVTETSINDLLATINAYIQAEILPLLSNTIQLVRLIGTLLDAVDSIAVTLNVSPPVVGGDAAESLPYNAAYAVSFLTTKRGRSFRGRNYVPGLTIGSVAPGSIVDGAFRSAIVAAYDGLRGVAGDDGWSMSVVSRVSDGAPRVTGIATQVSAVTTFDNVVDSMRRRLPGRGQ